MLNGITLSNANPLNYSIFNVNVKCGDFLRQLDKDAPDYFQYNECRLLDNQQGKPVEAIYQIDGTFAKQAEQYLINKTGIGALKHICCYWGMTDEQYGSFVNPLDNTYYRVNFSSEETLSNVPWEDLTFYLVIEVLSEDI